MNKHEAVQMADLYARLCSLLVVADGELYAFLAKMVKEWESYMTEDAARECG